MNVFLVAFLNGLSHVEQESGLAGAGRGYDESTLAATDGCHEVDQAGCEALRSGLETNLLIRIDRFQLLKGGQFTGIFGLFTIDRSDFDHLGAARTVACNPFEPNSWSESMLAGEIGRNKDVFFALFEILVGFPKKSKSLRGNLKETININGVAGEFEWPAVTLIALISLVVTGSVATDAALSLTSAATMAVATTTSAIATTSAIIAATASVPTTVTVSIAVTAVVIFAVALIGGLLAPGAR